MAGAGGPGGAAGGADTSPAALMAAGGTGRSGRRSATAAGTAAALPLPGGAGAAAPLPGRRGPCWSERYGFESRPCPVRLMGLDSAGGGVGLTPQRVVATWARVHGPGSAQRCQETGQEQQAETWAGSST